jgi:hypothetical protein
MEPLVLRKTKTPIPPVAGRARHVEESTMDHPVTRRRHVLVIRVLVITSAMAISREPLVPQSGKTGET